LARLPQRHLPASACRTHWQPWPCAAWAVRQALVQGGHDPALRVVDRPPVRCRLCHRTKPDPEIARMASRTPFAWVGWPSRRRLRGGVHLLAADASGYITGQVWGVNGGLDM